MALLCEKEMEGGFTGSRAQAARVRHRLWGLKPMRAQRMRSAHLTVMRAIIVQFGSLLNSRRYATFAAGPTPCLAAARWKAGRALQRSTYARTTGAFSSACGWCDVKFNTVVIRMSAGPNSSPRR